ncbi:hypothetical protein [Streptomyces sp. NPDC048623]|uniref:hypothetical protein n=1 Tax=Streptomyces sp. NPDC048623 TaxID=3155761 RepID=UPI00342C5FA5
MAPTAPRGTNPTPGGGAGAGGAADGLVDQIVFRWDGTNATGSTGFGPVAWSGRRAHVADVFRVAGPLLRASGDEIRTALIRMQSETEALLIRRMPWTDPGGSTATICHALVGPAGLLDPMTCLGLHEWLWQGSRLDFAGVRGAVLDRIPENVLIASRDAGLRALDADLARVEIELGGAVAELLRHQGGRYMFLDEHGDTALPVLWGLYGVFGDLLERRWSFATHDTAESNHLNFVFVGRWAGAASRNTDRHRSDPGERLGDEAETLAARLVAHHLRGVAAGDGEYAVSSHLDAAHRNRPHATLLECARAALYALGREREREREKERERDRESERERESRPQSRPRPATPTDPPVRREPEPEPVREAEPEPVRARKPVLAPVPVPVREPAPAPGSVPVPERSEQPAPRSAWGGPRRNRRGLVPGARRRARGHNTGPGDAELLAALRDRGRSYADTTALVQEAARRFPGWARPLQGELRDLVIGEEYFVTHPFADEWIAAAQRGADAAALHDWAVRPLLGIRGADPAADRLGDLLCRFAVRTAPEGRAVLRAIVALERPGLPERVWRDLVREAIPPAVHLGNRPEPPHPPQSQPEPQPQPQPQPRPRSQPRPQPAAPREPSRSSAPDVPHENDGWFAFALLGGILLLLVVSVVIAIVTS